MRLSFVFLTGLAACASTASDAAEQRVDTTGQRDSIAAVAASTMDEAQVVGLLAMTHAADSALGMLGATKGAALVTKEYGRMILREHHALRTDAISAGHDLGLEAQQPRVAPDAPPEAQYQALLQSEAGAGWDRRYIDYSIALHESSLENTARALAATKRPEIKDFIRKSVPILQKHIDKAKSMQKSLPLPKPVSADSTKTKGR